MNKLNESQNEIVNSYFNYFGIVEDYISNFKNENNILSCDLKDEENNSGYIIINFNDNSLEYCINGEKETHTFTLDV